VRLFGQYLEDADWLYRSPDWAQTRDSVLARDGYRCQSRLPDHSGTLQVHHVVPLRHGGKPLDDHNLVTLCRHHHQRAERLIPETRIVVPDGDARRWELAAALSGMSPERWVAAMLDRASAAAGVPPSDQGVAEEDKRYWRWSWTPEYVRCQACNRIRERHRGKCRCGETSFILIEEAV
jgi:hypothetical protein